MAQSSASGHSISSCTPPASRSEEETAQGDGKTYLIESLNNLEGAPVFLPYAIDCHGTIVRVFDPVYHQRIDDEDEGTVVAVGHAAPYDRRWVKCKRPFIVTGGELTESLASLRSWAQEAS